jgi:hypothetical protein
MLERLGLSETGSANRTNDRDAWRGQHESARTGNQQEIRPGWLCCLITWTALRQPTKIRGAA